MSEIDEHPNAKPVLIPTLIELFAKLIPICLDAHINITLYF